MVSPPARSAPPEEPVDPQTLLWVEHLRVWRDETQILKGIDWRVGCGEHWAVLGPNGSGKSSLMLSITGYLPFGAGRIYLLDGWLGHIHLPSQRRRIGLVSQNLSEHIATAHPTMSALDVVLCGLFGSLWLYDDVIPAQKLAGQSMLASLGVADLAERPFSLLSTGERQLCMLGRSRLADSELIIFDEPCAGLDLGARERFLTGVGQLLAADDAPTTVMITHHPEEIVQGATHVLLLRDGQVVAGGPKEATMTAANLSATFEVGVQVTANNGRYWVQVV